ncbi:MAG: hypothetical protein QOH63_3403 [Acidobacteriota bacterium]|jgi:hypothetical protein|nr:hypothetical protein [Acidobacteriota bacterium]MDT5062944.1 hypothetical protein [Acidobacteriota bacterium]
MRKDRFEQLLESVREGGALLRGEVEPSRAFHYPSVPGKRRNTEKSFAICVRTDDRELLIPNKIYQVALLENDLLKVIDEADESAVYPADYFLLVSFPDEVEKLLARVSK